MRGSPSVLLLLLRIGTTSLQPCAALQLHPFTNVKRGFPPPPPTPPLARPCENLPNALPLSTLSTAERRVRRTLPATTGADNNNNDDVDDAVAGTEKWTHSDLEWRLRPPPETSRWTRILVRAAAKALRLEYRLLRNPAPPILCPKGGSAVLEAYKGRKKIARFGITTTRGPPEPVLTQTIEKIYSITVPYGGAGTAAVIYMFVEPDYRGLGIGDLALEVIDAVHTVQNCDFTVLVADDDGSGSLVAWYERSGFTAAPDLQELFGSPGGEFGVTMIRPVQMKPDFFERCTVKWW